MTKIWCACHATCEGPARCECDCHLENWVEAVYLHGDYHFIAEDATTLKDLDGSIVGLDQCDNCGNSTYRIDGVHLECTDDLDGELTTDHITTGCGERRMIMLQPERKVVFP